MAGRDIFRAISLGESLPWVSWEVQIVHCASLS